MENIQSIIYIGTGCHFEIVSHFPRVSKFIFVDTQPRSEHDAQIFNPDFYRDTFVDAILAAAMKMDIILIDSHVIDSTYPSDEYTLPFMNPTLLTFVHTHTHQTVRYYISTNIRYNMNRWLIDDIKQSDALIVSGYFPDIVLYNYLGARPIQYIGYSKTCYTIALDEMKDTIYCGLYDNQYFDKYYSVDYESGRIIRYNTFMDFISKQNGVG